MPQELEDTLIVLTWNDPESFVRVMAERGEEVAAVITEPAVFNTGCVLPEPGYLELLRSETKKYGALLIFDEVITGFRFARGCAQEWFGVTPDITTLAKGLGGGFPVAAIGGSREVMSIIAEGRYSHSGTYNANVVQCAAVSATMDLSPSPGSTSAQRALGYRLADRIEQLARGQRFAARVDGLGTVFQLWFTDHAIHDWRDAEKWSSEALFTQWYQEMLRAACCSTPAISRTCSSRSCTPTRTSTRRSRRLRARSRRSREVADPAVEQREAVAVSSGAQR